MSSLTNYILESFNLTESAQSIQDEFDNLRYEYGMDDFDTVDFLLNFSNDTVKSNFNKLLDKLGNDDPKGMIFWLLDEMSDNEIKEAIEYFKEYTNFELDSSEIDLNIIDNKLKQKFGEDYSHKPICNKICDYVVKNDLIPYGDKIRSSIGYFIINGENIDTKVFSTDHYIIHDNNSQLYYDFTIKQFESYYPNNIKLSIPSIFRYNKELSKKVKYQINTLCNYNKEPIIFKDSKGNNIVFFVS